MRDQQVQGYNVTVVCNTKSFTEGCRRLCCLALDDLQGFSTSIVLGDHTKSATYFGCYLCAGASPCHRLKLERTSKTR
jgi:hypothetical protein